MAGEEGWTVALNLAGVEVVAAEVDGEQRRVRLTVVPQWPVAVCPHCGEVSTEVHQTREVEGVHDLPLADRAVSLTVRVSQFWCGRCARAFTPKLPEGAEGAHATERFLARASELIRFGDISQAAAFLRVPAPSLERWYYAWVERQQRAAAQPITSLGIDEVSLKKNTDSSSPSLLIIPTAACLTWWSLARRRQW
jgi:transposase